MSDPAQRTGLEMNFAAACLGASVCGLSAKTISDALDPQKETMGSPWLLWALLGLTKRMGVGDLKSLIDLSDGINGLWARLYTQDTPLEKWIKGTKYGSSPAEWSKSYQDSMLELYKIIFPISFDAYRLNELNPYRGMVESTYLILRLPGKNTLTDDMIIFEGEEVWGGIFGYGGKREKVKWTGNSFDRHEGTRVKTEAGVATYRRVYHTDREGRALNSISGKLSYSPMEGMTLPSIEIKDIAWL